MASHPYRTWACYWASCAYHFSELVGRINQSAELMCRFFQTERAACHQTGHPSKTGLV